MRLLIFAMALALTACAGQTPGGPTVPQKAALVTCSAEVSAVGILADLRAAKKLSAATIAKVDQDIALVDPVCSSPSAQLAVGSAAAAAAAELVNLAGGN